jgi:uncharacterized protein DUF4240
MDVEAFWELVNSTRKASGGDKSKQADLLVEALIQQSEGDILAFESILRDLMDEAYDAALWDAAYIIGCGCSDSGFVDFRAWVIAQGKEPFKSALVDPESLVDVVEISEDAQEGYLLNVAPDAYKRRTGREMPRKQRKVPLLKGIFSEEENISLRFPKLAAKFGDCEQRTKLWLGR